MVGTTGWGVLVQAAAAEGVGVGEGTGLRVGVGVSVGSSAGGGVLVSVGDAETAVAVGLVDGLGGLAVEMADSGGSLASADVGVLDGAGVKVGLSVEPAETGVTSEATAGTDPFAQALRLLVRLARSRSTAAMVVPLLPLAGFLW